MGGGRPNLLQYYNRGGRVYWDPNFVLRNKWTAPYELFHVLFDDLTDQVLQAQDKIEYESDAQ